MRAARLGMLVFLQHHRQISLANGPVTVGRAHGRFYRHMAKSLLGHVHHVGGKVQIIVGEGAAEERKSVV